MKTHVFNLKNLKQAFIVGALLSASPAFAEQPDSLNAAGKELPKPSFPKNSVKINLSSLSLNNYSLALERSLTPKVSFSAGYRNMPKTNLSEIKLMQRINKRFNEGEDLVEGMSRMEAGGSAYTAEVRFYGGKKPGARGFYLALYGRYATFDHDYEYRFTTQNERTIPVQIESKVNGIGGGLLLGKQWLISRRVVLDLYTIGGHYGKLTGTSKSTTDLTSLSPSEIRNLQSELDDILRIKDKPLLTSTVTSQGMTGKISGPFAGIRGLGFSLGIAF